MKCSLFLLLTSVLVGLAKSDTPTLVPAAPFDAIADVDKLNSAMVGAGTNEEKLIDVLCHRAEDQRVNISKTYMARYGKSLKDDLHEELSGFFREVLQSLTYTMTDYLAIELHRELQKSSLNTCSVQEILISKSNADVSKITAAYANLGSKHTVLADIEKKTSGSVKQMLSELTKGNRDESTNVDEGLVLQDAQDLYSAGWAQAEGNNPRVFINIFTTRNWVHLDAVFRMYVIKYARTIERVIKSEFSGDMQGLLLDIVQYSKSKATYFAQRLFKTMDGEGTKDYSLIRKIIGRCEIDLADIKVAYQKTYGTSLVSDVKGDLSGDYRKSILALIN